MLQSNQSIAPVLRARTRSKDAAEAWMDEFACICFGAHIIYADIMRARRASDTARSVARVEVHQTNREKKRPKINRWRHF